MEFSLISPINPQYSVTEQILTNRGIPLEEVSHYLHTTDADILPNCLLANLKEAAICLIKHIQSNDLTFVQVDSDCDGYTSSAVLLNYLNRLFPSYTQNNIIYRMHEGKQHGLIPEVVPENVKLIILPDSSSNDYIQHELFYSKGIDIIVLDHHIAEKESPYAITVNNQLCDYPNKSLSGVGIVYKFCSYIDELLGVKIADDLLDLVALGEIADVMDLSTFETRQLITKGMENIKNPFVQLKVEKEDYSLGGELTPTGVAFYIAPSVNAITRSGTQEEKMTLFESMLEYKAYDTVPSTKRGCSGGTEVRVEQACRYCANAKSRQTKLRDSALENAVNRIEEEGLLNNQLLILKNCDIASTLTGLVAIQISDTYKRPTLILNKTNRNGEVWYEGSGRNFDNSPLKDLRGELESCLSELGEGYAQGHSSAFGVGIPEKYYKEFVDNMEKRFAEYEFTPSYQVDYIFNGNNINPQDVCQIADLKNYWGQGVKEALVAITNLNIHKDNISLLKGTTIKIQLKEQGLELIKFRSSEEEYNELFTNSGCVTINVVGTCQINEWGQRRTPQIKIIDYEIMGRTAYYF